MTSLRKLAEETVDNFADLYPPEEDDPCFPQSRKDLIEMFEEALLRVREETIEEIAANYDNNCPACDGKNSKDNPCEGMDHVVAAQIRFLKSKGENEKSKR